MTSSRVASVVLALLAVAPAAAAQPALTPRERFDRGVALAAEGDPRAALVEFRAAYEATQNPAVLFNVAAAHEQLNEYVEARDALERYVRLAPPDDVARHRGEIVPALARLARRIGTLRVASSTPGILCALDGRARTDAELRAGLAVSAGRHALRCEAAGYEPRALPFEIGGEDTRALAVDLARVRATIAVSANVPGADVALDGRVVGRTPLASPLAVDEGTHRVEVARPGYEPAVAVVEARGVGARVEARLRWQEPVAPDVAARLVVRTTEPDATAALDGRPVPTDGSAGLPPGPHRLRVERADFLPVERDVVLAAGAQTTVALVLAPTPAYRDAWRARARGRRTLWRVVGGAGLVLAVAGGVAFGATLGPLLDADARYDDSAAAFARCAGATTVCAGGEASDHAAARDAAARDYNRAQPIVLGGAVALGVGLAGVVVGALLALDAPDVDRFERAPAFRVGVAPGGLAVTF